MHRVAPSTGPFGGIDLVPALPAMMRGACAAIGTAWRSAAMRISGTCSGVAEAVNFATCQR